MKELDPWLSIFGIAVKFNRTIAAQAICFTLVVALVAMGQEGSIPWQSNLEDAKRQAASENKLVLLHFGGDYCRPCLNLEKFVFTNPQVGSAIRESYVPVKIDVESQPALAKEFGITTIPHDVFLTPSGQVIAKQASSSNSDGYLRMIQTVAKKAARANPLAIASAQQIAEAAPADTSQITNAYVPVGQSSTIPEPIRMIGNSAPNLESPIKTVAGQLLSTQAKDERRLASPPAADKFLNDLRMTPRANATAETSSTQLDNTPINSATRAGQSWQTPRPSSEMFAPRPPQTTMPTNTLGQASTAIPNSVAIASEAIPAASSSPGLDDLKSTPTLPSTSPSTTVPFANRPYSSAAVQNPMAPSGKLPMGFGGSCPATWFATGEFVSGDPQWGCEHRGRLYLFASRELREQFRMTPDILSPMLAGYDAVAYATTGELRDGSLSHSVVLESDQVKSIYLFSSAENKAAFLINSQKYIDEVRQALRAADQAAVKR